MVPQRTALVPEARVEGHAAERGVAAPGIDRKEELAVAQLFVELPCG